jgi:hypothetical protein
VLVLGQGVEKGDFPVVLPWFEGSSRGGEFGVSQLRKLVGDGGVEGEGEGSTFVIGGSAS